MIYVLARYVYDYYEFCEILAASLDRSKLVALAKKNSEDPLFDEEQRKENDGYTHYFIHELKDGETM